MYINVYNKFIYFIDFFPLQFYINQSGLANKKIMTLRELSAKYSEVNKEK